MILPSNANIVVLASNYNPSIISKEWLYQKGIFTENTSNFVHTPVFALVESNDFSITVDERMLQLTIRNVTEGNLSASESIVEKFVDTLPETPYKAIGLNYRYAFPPERCDLHNILSPNDAKLGELISSNYEVGATIVFKLEKFIVNFTVLPALNSEQKVRMNFNFHSDVSNVNEVKERFTLRMITLEKAERIVQGLLKNG